MTLIGSVETGMESTPTGADGGLAEVVNVVDNLDAQWFDVHEALVPAPDHRDHLDRSIVITQIGPS